MMYVQASLLFASTVLSGVSFFMLPKRITVQHGKLFQTFGGSFLFSLTLVDVLPSLYGFAERDPSVLYYLLLGFLCQFFLDLLSHGVAHGHVHGSASRHPIGALGLVSALCLHALFDGFLVGGADCVAMLGEAHGHHGHAHHGHGLLGGVVLHKIPATMSLMAILVQHGYGRRTMGLYLCVFALASPLGCWLSTLWVAIPALFKVLWALSVGNLLHIATTTLSEAHADHRFTPSVLVANLAGAALAVMAAMH